MEEEAKRLLIMAHELAAAFVDSLFAENAFPAEKLDLALRMGIQGQTQQFLVFVMLSLLLEKRPGGEAANRALAENLKGIFLGELLTARRAAKTVLKASDLDDPFAVYYDSFANGAADPARSPFGILAKRLAERHFPSERRRAAYERIFALSAAYAERIAGVLPGPR